MCGGISCFSKLPDRAKERRRKKQNLRKRASLFSIQSYLSFLFNFYSEISLNFRLEDNGRNYMQLGIAGCFPVEPRCRCCGLRTLLSAPKPQLTYSFC